jgi:hypothetical protein
MYKVRRLRAMGAVCRQQAVYHPAKSMRLIAEAVYWEHLAEHELAVHFEECNAYRSSDEAKVSPSASLADRRWETIAAAGVLARERLGAGNLAG